MVLNRKEWPARRNFTFCHEIAHTFDLDWCAKLGTPLSIACGRPSIEEYLCDRAAAEMLMPEKFFKPSAEALQPSIESVFRLAASFAASIRATIVRLGGVGCWNVVFIVWKFGTRLGSSAKLRVSWSVRPAAVRCYVPRHASADCASGVYDAFVSGRRTVREEALSLGNLQGRHVVESVRFRDYVLSIVHKPKLSREERHAV